MLLLVNLREDVCSQKATYSFSVVYFPELLYVKKFKKIRYLAGKFLRTGQCCLLLVLPDEIRKCSRGQAQNVHEFYHRFMIPNVLYELTPQKRHIVFVAHPLNKSGQMIHYTEI